jgi:hypothetical protein
MLFYPGSSIFQKCSVDLAKIKMLDITGENKNLIPQL